MKAEAVRIQRDLQEQRRTTADAKRERGRGERGLPRGGHGLRRRGGGNVCGHRSLISVVNSIYNIKSHFNRYKDFNGILESDVPHFN